MLLRPLRVLLALVLAVFLAGCSSAGGGGTSTGTATPAPTRTVAAAAPTGTSGLPTVRVAELPPEARKTLALIAHGGPFPYARDGAVFSNFERILPRKERGYYHEYTVKTPGERDRGARRIVTGRGGETYYTDDHYETFREVVADEDR
ncbi:ribonuclease domain-containing protein [Streptomyces vietnamensis]|uniref:Guanine-specific ribonuclease N1 and T1 n=1 Tax=Streptomyces vietnamensis TaxID=362257 RepID=A0A0B5HUJ2_9ACTN|nr:ribonuclease domain-containing protein [Streptomyces vietnamensis]AJF64146.1 guanine-specific ribonuclease N1 and T1 [Streptomyces vietnamensis]